MKIFNESMTEELHSPDLSRGYLREENRFVTHHEAQEAVKETGHYVTVAEYANGGKDVEWIVDIPAAEAHEAYDEFEKVLVYVPYSSEQEQEIRKKTLRARRRTLLIAFDKWEKAVLRGRETDDAVIMAWYRAILDLSEWAFDAVPERVKYYL